MSPAARRSVSILVACDAPLQVCDREIFADETSFKIDIAPSAVSHLPGMKLAMMFEELLLSLEPTSEHVDEVDLRRHESRGRFRVVVVPSIGPSGNQFFDFGGRLEQGKGRSQHEVRGCKNQTVQLE